MKNKIFIFLLQFIFIFGNSLSANEFTIESTEIKILEKGKVTEAKKGVKIISPKKFVSGFKSTYQARMLDIIKRG